MWLLMFYLQITKLLPFSTHGLGDIFDDGKWSSDEAFQADVRRYNKIFSHSPSVELAAIIGNHDVGFHYM